MIYCINPVLWSFLLDCTPQPLWEAREKPSVLTQKGREGWMSGWMSKRALASWWVEGSAVPIYAS